MWVCDTKANCSGSTLNPLRDYSTIVCKSAIKHKRGICWNRSIRTLAYAVLYGMFIWSSFKPALQWDNHFPSLLYETAPRDDSNMFIFLEFRFGCLHSPYQKYSDVCSSCSVYTFFSEVFIANPPCGFNVRVQIHPVVIEAGGVSSALNALEPIWLRSWEFPNIAPELRLNIDRCSYVPLSAHAHNYNRRSTLLLTMHLSWACGCPVKGMLGILKEPGLQNCYWWLRNSIIYSTSCETENRTPSTGWYHWHGSIHRHASVTSVLFWIIAASAQNESRCLSRSLISINSFRGSQILSSWFLITLTQAFH